MSELENHDLLDEQEVAEESTPDMSYDKKGEEGKAVAAADNAATATKQSPGRKGDKKNGEAKQKVVAGDPDKTSDGPREDVEMITTKGGMINAMYQKMNGLTKEELSKVFMTVMAEDMVDEEAIAEETYQKKLAKLSEDEVTLSEEFKAKTAILFEAALQSKVAEEVERIESNYEERLAEEVQSQRGDLVEKVDSYLNYVVEQWMEENKLAIQNGLRTEIAENFMEGMKGLFLESYVAVPESKVDLVDDLASQVEELEEAMSQQMQESMKLMEQVAMMKKERILAEASADLADTQAEKLRNFFASVDFDDEDTFVKKVDTVKEAHFSGAAPATDEEVFDEDGETSVPSAPVSNVMENYISAIRKTSK